MATVEPDAARWEEIRGRELWKGTVGAGQGIFNLLPSATVGDI